MHSQFVINTMIHSHYIYLLKKITHYSLPKFSTRTSQGSRQSQPKTSLLANQRTNFDLIKIEKEKAAT